MTRIPFEVWAIAFIGFLAAMGFGIVAPVLPTLGSVFGVGITAMSLAISGLAGGRLLGNLVLARFVHRWPLRTTLASGLAFQGLTTVLSGLATAYVPFIALRCISGFGSAAFSISSTALLVALAPAARRGRAMSLYAGATALGTVSGPAVGAALTLVSPHAPLLAHGVALTAGAAVALVVLRRARLVKTVDPDGARGTVPTRRREAARQIFGDRALIAVLMCQLVLGWVFYGLRIGLLPGYLEELGYSVAFVGLMLVIAAGAQLIATTVGGGVSDRIGRVPPLTVALLIALGSLALLDRAAQPAIATIAFIGLGLAAGMQASTSTALLADSPNGHTARGAALYWLVFDLAAIVGPVVSGLLADGFAPRWALLPAAVIVVVAIFFVLRVRRSSSP